MIAKQFLITGCSGLSLALLMSLIFRLQLGFPKRIWLDKALARQMDYRQRCRCRFIGARVLLCTGDDARHDPGLFVLTAGSAVLFPTCFIPLQVGAGTWRHHF